MRESSDSFLYNQYLAPARSMNPIAEATERYVNPMICGKIQRMNVSNSHSAEFLFLWKLHENQWVS